MRVFALILLIFVCFLFCVSALFKFASWPGGSFGILTGTLLYIIAYAPVFLIYAFRNAALQPVKINIIAGVSGTAVALVCLLYFNLHWSESMLLLIMCALAVVPAIVLYFKNRAAHAALFKSYRLFSILTIIVLLSAASCVIPVITKNNRMEAEMRRYHDEHDAYFDAESKLRETGARLAVNDSIRGEMEKVLSIYSDAEFKIADAQMELIASATGYRKEEMNEVPPEFIPWDETDIVEFLFVGFDSENPQGKGLEIGTALRQLKLNLQAKGMNLDADVPASDSKTDLALWVKTNFHKKDIAQTMTLLYSFRTAIITRFRQDMENNFSPKE